MKKMSAKNNSARMPIASARRLSPPDQMRAAPIARPKAHKDKQPLCTALSLKGTPGALNQCQGPVGHRNDAQDKASTIRHAARKPTAICRACRGVTALSLHLVAHDTLS